MTIVANDQAVLYALRDSAGAVVFSGTLPPGQCIATSLTPVASTDGQAVANAVGDKLPPLPDSGLLVAGELYRYGDGVVQVRQSHQRTIYPPEQTPALFNIWRPEVPGQPWIAGEQVQIGTQRTYDGVTYVCLQAHVTEFAPPLVPALWRMVVNSEEPQPWVQPTGAHDAYALGDRVTYGGFTWESTIDANVWAPGVYGWVQV